MNSVLTKINTTQIYATQIDTNIDAMQIDVKGLLKKVLWSLFKISQPWSCEVFFFLHIWSSFSRVWTKKTFKSSLVRPLCHPVYREIWENCLRIWWCVKSHLRSRWHKTYRVLRPPAISWPAGPGGRRSFRKLGALIYTARCSDHATTS
jgi:hypothetical protein